MTRGITNIRSILSMDTLFIMLGYGLYKAISFNSYMTDFGLTPVSYGYISNTAFMTAVTFSILVTAAVLFIWARGPRKRDISGNDGADRIARLSFSLNHPVPLLMLGACYLLAIPVSGGIASGALGQTTVMYVFGTVWGIATTFVSIVWVELFVHERSPVALVLELAAGSLAVSIISPILSALPEPASMVICTLLTLCCIPLVTACRRRADPIATTERQGSLRETLMRSSSPFLAYLFFELITGLINMFAYEVPSAFTISSSAPLTSMAIGAAIVVAIVVLTDRIPNPSIVYLVIFPVAIALFLLLPFFGTSLGHPISTVIYTAYILTSMLFMFCYVTAIRDTGANVYRAGATLSFLARAFLYAGIMLGYRFGRMPEGESFVQVSIVAVVCIYCLGLLIALWAYRSLKGRKALEAQAASAEVSAAASTPETYEQSVADKVDDLVAAYGLTNRERDVLVGLSRGNSAAAIADDLCISTSTAQSYIKTLYAKLGVNRKQQVLDMFERK